MTSWIFAVVRYAAARARAEWYVQVGLGVVLKVMLIVEEL